MQIEQMADEDLRRLVIDAVRRAGFRGGAEVLGVSPRELSRLVCRRGIDLVDALISQKLTEPGPYPPENDVVDPNLEP